MDIRVLGYFLTIAREENITKAAALLHLTQPTLSRQMMQLEEDGCETFHQKQAQHNPDRTGHAFEAQGSGDRILVRKDETGAYFRR